MDFLTELVTAALGIAIGYLIKKPAAKELIERIRVEYVDKPVVVEKWKVERVEVPVLVDKPCVQIERVPHETVIERETIKVVDKPVLQIERVEVPVVVDRPVVQIERVPVETHHETVKVIEKPFVQIEQVEVPVPARLESSKGGPISRVDVVYMDQHERKVLDTVRMDARLRRPTVTHRDRKYQCVKQDAQGRWVYRQVAH